VNFYKRHLGDYAKDAGHLSMLEHGAYTLLLDRYYATECAIPSREDAYRACRARTKEERKAVDDVLREFFTTDGESFMNKRAEAEIAKASHQRTVNQEVGKRGGRPKKTDSETDSVIGSESDSVPIRNPSQTPDSISQTPEEENPPATRVPPAVAVVKSIEPKVLKASDLVAEGVDPGVARDWLVIRKAKKAPLTPTAWEGVKREAEAAGVTPAQAVKLAVEGGWQGFKAAWLHHGKGVMTARDDLYAGAV
jgi:uncharacterized protein YdaU (DUF1376 family)